MALLSPSLDLLPAQQLKFTPGHLEGPPRPCSNAEDGISTGEMLLVAFGIILHIVCVCVCVCMEKGMATHSSILAWRITWTEELGGLQSVGSQRVRHDGSDLARISVCISTYIGTYTEW